MRTTHWIACAIVAAGFALVGCSRTVVYKDKGPDVVVVEKNKPVGIDDHRNGPPAHAPAHGYRRKHGGKSGSVVLIYDRRLQVYSVEGFPGCYYSAGQYFRLGDTGWSWSVEINGPWRVVEVESDVPPGLRKHRPKGDSKKKDARGEPKKYKGKDNDKNDKAADKGKAKAKNDKDKGEGKDAGDSKSGDSRNDDTGDSDSDTGGGDDSDTGGR